MTIDARQFNIQDAEGHYLCPVCGFPNFLRNPTYDEKQGLIGTTICPCCLFEPGFDDEACLNHHHTSKILSSIRIYRNNWLRNPKWKGDSKLKPKGWDGKLQVMLLFEIASYVR